MAVQTEGTTRSTAAGLPILRAGFVIGERYQVEKRLHADVLSATYLCRDHEDASNVLVRVMTPQLAPTAEAQRGYVDRVAATGLVSGERPNLLPILDADVHEGPQLTTPYFVTPAPEGERLDLLLAREGKLAPEIALDYLADVAQAISDLPAGRHHGDVRAEHVYITEDGAVLGGAFAIESAPKRELGALLRNKGALRSAFAPEVLTGAARDAADRYQFGLLAHRILVGGPLPEPGDAMPARLGGVGDAVAALLTPHPRRRAEALMPLLAALCRQTGRRLPGIIMMGSGIPSSRPSSPPGDAGRSEEVTKRSRSGRPPARSMQDTLDTHRPPDADPEGTAELSLNELHALAAGSVRPAADRTMQVRLEDVLVRDDEDEPAEADVPSVDDAPVGFETVDYGAPVDDLAEAAPPREDATMQVHFSDLVEMAEAQAAKDASGASSAGPDDPTAPFALASALEGRRADESTDIIRTGDDEIPRTRVTERPRAPAITEVPPPPDPVAKGAPKKRSKRRFKKRYAFAAALALSVVIIGGSLLYRWSEMERARDAREQRVRDRLMQLQQER